MEKVTRVTVLILIPILLAVSMTTALAAPVQQAEGTIVDIAAGDEQFSTLVTALQTAGLVETLQGEGPFTVFAPTNEAFDKLPEGELDRLLNDVPALTEILQYHVVEGRVMAADVVNLTEAPTLQGSAAPITVDGENVMIGDANVVTADIEATNGVIHVIDTVLMPPAEEDAMAEDEMMEEPAMEGQTIVDIAAGDEQFSTLVTALQTAGLVETLQGEGPFTVFAPTNDAFAKLPEGTLDSLLNDIPTLTDILQYHVVPGQVMAADVTGLSEATTVQGAAAPITVDGENVMIGDANVIATDIQASNGVIHVIDTVLMPPAQEGEEAMEGEMMETPAFCSEDYTVQADDWLSRIAERYYGDVLAFDVIVEATNEAAATNDRYTTIDNPDIIEIGQVLCIPASSEGAMEEGAMEEGATGPTIVDVAAGDEQFSTLVTALQTAGLVETLQGEGPFTVFAPTNEAFNNLPEGELDRLLNDVPALTDVLLYHVVEGRVMAADVVNLASADTVFGPPLNITVDGESVRINDANVITTDIEASNGVIHVIDAVLLPPEGEEAMMEEPAEEPAMEEQTIVDIAAGDEQFSTLVTALQTAGLVETLQGEGPFTVFAPTNEAFDNLPEGELDRLLNDVSALTDILQYHVVDGQVMAADVVNMTEVTTLQGSAAPITVDGDTVMIGEATVTATDIEASNGVIHVIDSVLIPQN